jgi:hypothetical protein
MDVEAAAAKEMETVRAKYTDTVARLENRIKGNKKALVAHMKANKREFFGQGDRLKLPAGVLCYMRQLQVSIPRDALEKAEQLGLTDAIKIAKSLDRAVVEKWPVERLVLIGAERKPKETFSYELKIDD